MLRAPEKLLPDLMDVYRLFPPVDVEQRFDASSLESVFLYGGEETRKGYEPLPGEAEHCRREALEKRYAKLALYEFLSETTGRTLPWGSLTGIRPTRLAYAQAPDDFRPLFRRWGVSEENIALVGRVLAAQEGIRGGGEGADLYVSIPFCPSKCVYCSFITAPIDKTRSYLPGYLSALEREIAGARIGKLRSLYIGGGTPFVLDPPALGRVLHAVRGFADMGVEFTVEAGRPDVFTREKLDLCARYGVTRLCVNAQSFSDRTLEAIGRKHTAEEVRQAFRLAREYPFDLNCDLIAGLTGESFEAFAASVDEAIRLSPENITVHTLCLKRGARLKEERLEQQGRGVGASVRPLGDDMLADMIAYSREKLTAAGYEPYYLYRQKYMAGAHENVGWTKPGHACVYNIDVMEETSDNLAFGANAVSKRVFCAGERIERYGSPKDIPTYIAKVDTIVEEKNKLFGA